MNNVRTSRSADFCDIERDEYLCIANTLVGSMGPMWECMTSEETVFKALHDALSNSIYDLNQFICKAAEQANPCTADCFVDDWLKIFGVYDCLRPDQRTLELVCELYKNRGLFTCNTIKRLAAIEGFAVTECSLLCEDCFADCCLDGFGSLMTGNKPFVFETTYETCSTSGSSPNYLQFPEPPGTSYASFDPKCSIDFSSNPCAVCCDFPVQINIPTPPNDPCEPNPPVPCDCETPEARGCRTFADYTAVVKTYPELNPTSTLVVKIKGANPCNAGLDTFGTMFVTNNFTICLIDELKPAYLKIRYQFDC